MVVRLEVKSALHRIKSAVIPVAIILAGDHKFDRPVLLDSKAVLILVFWPSVNILEQ